MNDKAVLNIQRQVDTLSDGHRAVVDQAVKATGMIVRMDDRLESKGGAGMLSRLSGKGLEELRYLLLAQAARALRVCAEVEEIQRTLKVN